MRRGVCGGERKRVTTGEMQSGQRYLSLVDEVCTGLDIAVTYIIKTQRPGDARGGFSSHLVPVSGPSLTDSDLQGGPRNFLQATWCQVLPDGCLSGRKLGCAGSPGSCRDSGARDSGVLDVWLRFLGRGVYHLHDLAAASWFFCLSAMSPNLDIAKPTSDVQCIPASGQYGFDGQEVRLCERVSRPAGHARHRRPNRARDSQEQMKRLTIGVELVAQPSILFLDEPTSGLDAHSAKLIMDGVRKVAESGRTIVCTIHQPSSDVFFLFDHLLLVKHGGESVFVGELGEKCHKLVDYLEAMPGTSPCPKDQNPASWMLEVIGAGAGHHSAAATDFVQHFKQSREAQVAVQHHSAAVYTLDLVGTRVLRLPRRADAEQDAGYLRKRRVKHRLPTIDGPSRDARSQRCVESTFKYKHDEIWSNFGFVFVVLGIFLSFSALSLRYINHT